MKYRRGEKILKLLIAIIICIVFFSLGKIVDNKSLMQRKMEVKDYKSNIMDTDVHQLIQDENVYKLTELQKEEAYKKLNDLINSNNLKNVSDQKAIKTTAEIIYSSIEYDNEHTYKTGLDTIYYGKGDCAGMADLFSTIMDELKIESYVVPIYLNVPDRILYYSQDDIWKRIKSSGHAINMVKVNSEFMFIDSSWDVGLMSEEEFYTNDIYLKTYLSNDGDGEYIFKYKIGQTFYNIIEGNTDGIY